MVFALQYPGFFSGGAAKKNGPDRKEVHVIVMVHEKIVSYPDRLFRQKKIPW